jgi:fibronectin type 3 domain-containing protein
MKKILLNITLLVSFALGLTAQDTIPSQLRLFAKETTEGVALKVIPQTPSVWLEGVEYGYNYYRRGLNDEQFTKLNTDAIKPLKDSGFENFEKGDSLKAFNKKAVFNSLAQSKVERTPSDAYRYFRQRDQEFAFYILVSTRLRDISLISGMEFVDTSAETGKEYIYKVEIAGQPHSATQYHSSTSYGVLVPNLEAESGDRMIHLSWKHQDQGSIVCYHLEKGEDANSFQRLTTAPIYPATSMQEIDQDYVFKNDSVAQNYQSYAYRLIGLDVWGDEVKSKEVHYFMAIDRTPPTLPSKIETKVNKEEKSITLKWQNTNISPDFKACMVYYSNERNGMYHPLGEAITDPQQSSYTIDSLSEFDRHYFKLVYADTNENFSTSEIVFAELPDIYPPSVPIALKAEVGENGVIHLSWKANEEPDLRAYMVYRSTNGKTNYLTITPMHTKHNAWVDSFAPAGLNKDVYYYVRAIDRMYNYSGCSDTLRVLLPDTTAPVAAQLMQPKMDKSEVSLEWIPSSSSDLTSQYLVVKANGQTVDSIALEAQTRNYQFTSSQSADYTFQIVSTDANSNHQYSNQRHLSTQENSAQAIQDFKAKSKDGKVELKWSVTTDAKYYLVYRQQKGGSLERIASTQTGQYTDTHVQRGTTYFYYVVAKDSSGRTIAESEHKKVKR